MIYATMMVMGRRCESRGILLGNGALYERLENGQEDW